MPTPAELHQAEADAAAARRDAAVTDEERAFHDRAWAEHFTARNHALLAERHAQQALGARQAAGHARRIGRRTVAEELVAAAERSDAASLHHATQSRSRHDRGADLSTAARTFARPAEPPEPVEASPQAAGDAEAVASDDFGQRLETSSDAPRAS